MTCFERSSFTIHSFSNNVLMFGGGPMFFAIFYMQII